MNRFTALVVALSLFAAPLRAQTNPATQAVDQLPSVVLPAELDRVLRDYERAWLANDLPGLVSLFTEDGFVLQSGKLPARGREAMMNVYRGQGGGMLKLRALAYAHADSVGYIIGAYSYGDSTTDQGKFTLTLRRVGGKWLIASDMDNGNQSRRGPAPPSQ